jgi:hypothetical protein
MPFFMPAIYKTCLLHDGFLLGFLFHPEYGAGMFLRKVGCLSTDYTALARQQIKFGLLPASRWLLSRPILQP